MKGIKIDDSFFNNSDQWTCRYHFGRSTFIHKKQVIYKEIE